MESVPISSLVPADSPRTGGVDPEHVRRLADSDSPFPPIVVQQGTLRVIDGMHRLRASALRGDSHIQVRFFQGTNEDAFALAVRLNASHGLPLSRSDRVNAASRILVSHPQWSDRAIASVTGLGSKAVAALRRRSTDALPRLNSRTGRDGRVRPLDPAPGRRAAAELIAENPGASLREIAQRAGIAVATAKDVRERLRLGQDAVPLPRSGEQGHREAGGRRVPGPVARPPVRRGPDLDVLKNDPSLRYNEQGRAVLRLLGASAIGIEDWDRLIESVPAHCVDAVAEAARNCAERWRTFAVELERRRVAAARQRPDAGRAQEGATESCGEVRQEAVHTSWA
uniref:ParB/RepB/Spo0J family partition protein n=1 Tax=Streptoalloteichus hindustanus TaxID=2017 RepID=UPI0022867CDD|nr:ParB N-terminal domain-containing protein [Streptoalloteichus hindustanus]